MLLRHRPSLVLLLTRLQILFSNCWCCCFQHWWCCCWSNKWILISAYFDRFQIVIFISEINFPGKHVHAEKDNTYWDIVFNLRHNAFQWSLLKWPWYNLHSCELLTLSWRLWIRLSPKLTIGNIIDLMHFFYITVHQQFNTLWSTWYGSNIEEVENITTL